MPRPGFPNLSRSVLLALIALSPLGARPARAAGCHVPDRPVLGAGFQSRLSAWELADSVQVAPPIVKRLPCPGEVPHATVVVVLPIAADHAAMTEDEPSLPCRSIVNGDDAEMPPPRASRLDRPPRRSGFPA